MFLYLAPPTEIIREHWIHRITFAAEINAALGRAVAAGRTDRPTHIHIHRRRRAQYLLRWQSGKGNQIAAGMLADRLCYYITNI